QPFALGDIYQGAISYIFIDPGPLCVEVAPWPQDYDPVAIVLHKITYRIHYLIVKNLFKKTIIFLIHYRATLNRFYCNVLKHI
ncbi:MAG TPA: hypothetical protein PKN70_04485, partial [Smithellaceae bacterium]|nr:hypothetical protein [Smithellaceae bacterium]